MRAIFQGTKNKEKFEKVPKFPRLISWCMDIIRGMLIYYDRYDHHDIYDHHDDDRGAWTSSEVDDYKYDSDEDKMIIEAASI